VSDEAAKPAHRADPWRSLRRYTDARIALGRAGGSLPTRALLEFQLAHAQARDAVARELDLDALEAALDTRGWPTSRLRSAAPDRRGYIQRPDLGRILAPESKALLESQVHSASDGPDVVFVLADGLSAIALERHAVPLLDRVLPELDGSGWRLAPVCLVQQGRVAVGDEIGSLLGAAMSVVLIGERPGLSSPDSLGIYLTWNPLPGCSNAQRNCISNVRPQGLDYPRAAHQLLHLMDASRRLRLSGVALKDEAPALPAT